MLLLIKYFLDTFYYSLAMIGVCATLYIHHSPYNQFYHKLIMIIFLYLKTKKIVSTSSKQQLPLHSIRKVNSDTTEKLVLITILIKNNSVVGSRMSAVTQTVVITTILNNLLILSL